MPQFTLNQKIFVVKSYYSSGEDYDSTLKLLADRYRQIFGGGDDNIKSLKLIINLFEKTGSVQNSVSYTAPSRHAKSRLPPAPPVVVKEAPDEDVDLPSAESVEETYHTVEVYDEVFDPSQDIEETVESKVKAELNTSAPVEDVPESSSVQTKLCAQCGEAVPKSQFSSHMKSHDAPEIFKCDECGRELKSKYNLKMHKRTHLKPEERAVDGIICEVCGKVSFSTVLHKMHLLMHSEEKPFACKQCPMTFRRKNGLYKHELSHKGVRPLVCSECGASFLAHMTLQMHMRTHTGERPYSCHHCGKRFIGRPSLNAHLKLNHPEEYPHECEICGGHFKTVKTLNDHIEKKHSGTIVEYHIVDEGQEAKDIIGGH